MVWLILIGLVMVAMIIAWLKGFKTIQEQERAVIETWGKYSRTLKPGLNWIFPGIEKARAIVDIWEGSIPLFEKPIKIDFLDGAATPNGAKVLVKIASPDKPYKVDESFDLVQDKNVVKIIDDEKEKNTGVCRAIYETGDWRSRIREHVESAVRAHFSGMTIDEGTAVCKSELGKSKEATFDLMTQFSDLSRNALKKKLLIWGFELLSVTVMDFDLEPDLVKARGEVQKMKKQKEAAEQERQKNAQKIIGSYIDMLCLASGKKVPEIQEEMKSDAETKNLVKELLQQIMSLEAGALTEIKVQGGDSLQRGLLQLISAFRQPPSKVATDKEEQ